MKMENDEAQLDWKILMKNANFAKLKSLVPGFLRAIAGILKMFKFHFIAKTKWLQKLCKKSCDWFIAFFERLN